MGRSMTKVERLIEMERLYYVRPYSDEEMGKALGVDRTLAFRYRKELSDPPNNLEIIKDDGGRWKVDRMQYISNIRLNRYEALVLYLAARRASQQGRLAGTHLANALEKLSQSLKQPMTARLVRSADEVLQGHIDPERMKIFEKVTRGWVEGHKLQIKYHSLRTQQPREHVVRPYLIEPSPWSDSVYMIGFNDKHENISVYKIERIVSAFVSGETFEIPDDFDKSELLKHAWGIWARDAEPVTVKLRFIPGPAARRLQESVWHPLEEVSPTEDGGCIWQAPIAQPKEMLPWVRGWGADVEVLEPEKLRKALTWEARRLAKVYEVVGKGKELVAHVRERDGEIQTVEEHLNEVAKLAGIFAGKIGLKESGEILGLLHDLGKASKEFQNYIGSATGLLEKNSPEWVDYIAKKGRVDHSSAGAQVLYQRLSKKGQHGQIAAQAFSLCIASHHSGLIDCLSPDGKNNFQRRIEKSDEQTHAIEALSQLPQIDKMLDDLLSKSIVEEQFFNKLNSLRTTSESRDTLNFKRGLLIRYLLSCILDADRLNTADYEFPGNVEIRNYGEYHSWDILIQRLDNKIKEFDEKEEKNEVDELRNDVSQACLNFSTKERGVYQLTVPTGGGKTISSLRFALNHAKHHNLDRIFYIIPYTSIIDQNADEIRKILEDKDEDGNYLNKVVLEHHSNLIPNEDEIQKRSWLTEKRQKLLSENWDAPVVFTTQVQFLEALFGSGTRSARRMHQLANSVIIFDEVQTIPIRTVWMFNAAVKFLVHSCGSTAVLCTATQPLLDKIKPNQHALTIDGKIIPNEKDLFKKLQRVEVFDERKVGGGWNDKEVAELVEQELQEKGSVLIIVNTKKSALSLYQAIFERSDTKVYHLSTRMCPVHRLKVLDRIKEKLDAKEPVICVSTQLIEAGVDIDFGTVIRYLAGLASITQAAGRCNRNGEQEGLGNVWIVNPEQENIDKLIDIKKGIKVAERILGEFDDNPEAFENDRLGLDAMTRYYKYYFYRRKDEMSYNLPKSSSVDREDTLFNLLSRNTIAAQRDTSVMGSSSAFLFKQAFQTASREFHAIDALTRGVIVPYGKGGEEIVNDLCGAFELEKEYKLIKKAQRYSVNLFPHEFKRMVKEEAIREVQEGSGVYYLDYQYYSEEFGWSDEVATQMKTLIG